jgi:hypothetical protein
MNTIKIMAILLITAGVLGLAYGSFSYTKETHEGSLGPIQLAVNETENVNVPVWAGVGVIALGALFLIIPTWKKND